MVRKQVSLQLGRTRLWRRSNQALLFFSLLFVPFYLFSMDYTYSPGDLSFAGRDTEFLREAYSDNPSFDIRDTIDFLKDPDEFIGLNDRFSFFEGPPGGGKTTTALSIPVVAEWEGRYKIPSNFQTENRNEASIHLLNDFEKVIAKGKKSDRKTVYIIDEINQLLDHAESKEHDNDGTSKTLWTVLDAQNTNRNFFFVGVANDYSKVAEQIKSRALPKVVYFDGSFTSDDKKKTFLKYLLVDRVVLSRECNDAFITQHVDAAPISARRDLRSIAMMLLLNARRSRTDRNNRQLSISSQHILDALERYTATRERQCVGRKEKSDYEQREDHHRESLAKQDQLFAQQQAMAIITSQHQYIGTSFQPFGIGASKQPQISGNGVEEIRAQLSDEQKNFFPDSFNSRF